MQASKLLLAIASLASVTTAGTYVVDAAGGGDFTDLAPAIAFASPGDVLLIQPGNYGGFTLDKRLTLVGQGAGVIVNGPATIRDIVAGNATSIVGVRFSNSLEVTQCTRPVVFDDVTSSSRGLIVDGSSDVRVSRSYLDGWDQYAGLTGTCLVVDSRVELASSVVLGEPGSDGAFTVPGDGLEALIGSGAVVGVHLYRSTLIGGDGGHDLGGFFPSGQGAAAVRLDDAGTVLAAGTAQDMLLGGSDDNGQAAGVRAWSGSVRHSSVVTSGVYAAYVETPPIPDPSLYFVGTPTPGSVTTFRIAAPVGSTVDLRMGRFPTIVDVPGLAEDVLVTPQRTFHLGAVGASGVIGFNFPMPGSFPKGFTFFAQAKVTIAPGDERYTNSVPIVLR
ncbi:MAG: hypothetical protein HZA52_14220 [Planctomycetes bacterium]|nr:hypothetical protein [Planctomycetota bacterium]